MKECAARFEYVNWRPLAECAEGTDPVQLRIEKLRGRYSTDLFDLETEQLEACTRVDVRRRDTREKCTEYYVFPGGGMYQVNRYFSPTSARIQIDFSPVDRWRAAEG